MKAALKRADPWLCLFGAVALLLEGQVVAAGPLDLDKSFNVTGKVTTDFKLNPQFAQDIGRGIAVQQDGKILVAGTVFSGSQKRYDFALARYNPNGSLDQTFGTDGLVTTDFASSDDDAVQLAIQPDGKIVLAGDAADPQGAAKTRDFALARYNADGTLDQSFGTNGIVRIDFGKFESAKDMVLQPDGKIVVAGQQKPSDDDSDFLIVRYMPDGALDGSFGNAGKTVTNFGAWDIGWAVDIRNDGKIVIAGSSWGPNFQPLFGALARYTPTGVLDQTFDQGQGWLCVLSKSCGKTKIALGGKPFDYPVSLALRKADGTEDGKILIAGQFGMARLDANGTLDGTFGSAGVVDKADNTGRALGILADGSILVAGDIASDFAIAIYRATGNLCSGKSSAQTDFNSGIDGALALTIQADGKILLTGYADNGTDWDFGLVRYLGGKCPFEVSGGFLAHHIFVHPQELVGPNWPGFRFKPYDQLNIGQTERLAIPVSEGGAFGDEKRPGYQSFKLTAASDEVRQRPPFVSVTNAKGDSLLEIIDVQALMVPTDIAAESAGGVTAVGADEAALMKCYRVKAHGQKSVEGNPTLVRFTDALNRSWTFEIGEPESLCKPIDRRGRDLEGVTASLVGYRVKDLSREGERASVVRLPTANELGAQVLPIAEPELLFLPSDIE